MAADMHHIHDDLEPTRTTEEGTPSYAGVGSGLAKVGTKKELESTPGALETGCLTFWCRKAAPGHGTTEWPLGGCTIGFGVRCGSATREYQIAAAGGGGASKYFG